MEVFSVHGPKIYRLISENLFCLRTAFEDLLYNTAAVLNFGKFCKQYAAMYCMHPACARWIFIVPYGLVRTPFLSYASKFAPAPV